ncbi:MAG: THUMP-like domain-containing protein [Cumulibacter sp.]
MDSSVLPALISSSGRAEVARVAGELASGADTLRVLSRLRAAYDTSVASAILLQAELRPKAIAKFGPGADGLIVLAQSLEQASRVEVSARRARRLVALGVTEVTDAGAGLGADTLAYASAGLTVRAVEHSQTVAAVLRANTAGLAVQVIEDDALAVVAGLPAGSVAYFDPARRADGRRIFDPQLCSPPLSALVATHERGLTVVAKMSPSLNYSDVPAGWDAEWVSTQTEQGRSVVEAVLWSPPHAAGARRAVVMSGDTEHVLSGTGAPARIGALGAFVYEPDGAVNQAGLIGELAQQLSGRLIEPRIAYLSSDCAIDTPFAHRYEVLESLPWAKRALARTLAKYDASDLVVKKRGISVDPTALRRELLPRLRSRAGDPLVLILAGRLAIVARAG